MVMHKAPQKYKRPAGVEDRRWRQSQQTPISCVTGAAATCPASKQVASSHRKQMQGMAHSCSTGPQERGPRPVQKKCLLGPIYRLNNKHGNAETTCPCNQAHQITIAQLRKGSFSVSAPWAAQLPSHQQTWKSTDAVGRLLSWHIYTANVAGHSCMEATLHKSLGTHSGSLKKIETNAPPFFIAALIPWLSS